MEDTRNLADAWIEYADQHKEIRISKVHCLELNAGPTTHQPFAPTTNHLFPHLAWIKEMIICIQLGDIHHLVDAWIAHTDHYKRTTVPIDLA